MRNTAKAEPLLEAAAAAGVGVEVAELDVIIERFGRSCDRRRSSNRPAASTSWSTTPVSSCSAPSTSSPTTRPSRQLDTNVLGVVRVARAAVPHMVRQGQGSIVNVGSVAGKVGVPYSGLYAASKHAVEAITEAMHFELAHLGIRVAVVEPGQFATGLSGNSVVAASMPEDSAEYVRWQAFRGRMRQLVGGVPADAQLVADVIYEAATSDRAAAAVAGRRRRLTRARHQSGDVVRRLRIGDAHHPRLARVTRAAEPSHRPFWAAEPCGCRKVWQPRTVRRSACRRQRGQSVTRARTIVQGSGLFTCSTSNRPPTKRLNPRRDQWLTWPGVLPSWRT